MPPVNDIPGEPTTGKLDADAVIAVANTDAVVSHVR